MKNLDIRFPSDGRVSLSAETYEELRSFCIHHGETDLPASGGPLPEAAVKALNDLTVAMFPQPLDPQNSATIVPKLV